MKDLNVLLDWAKRPEETQADYQEFSEWLMDPKRQTPENTALSIKHSWAERAAAFDSAGRLQQMSPAEQRIAFMAFSPAVALMAMQTYAKQLASGQERVTPQDLRALQELDRTGSGISDGTPTLDVSRLPDDEQRKLKELCEKLSKP